MFYKISIAITFAFASCREPIAPAEINQEKFCDYFLLRTQTRNVNGQKMFSSSDEQKFYANDRVSSFMKKHQQRFSYLSFDFFARKRWYVSVRDSAARQLQYCADLQSDKKFYQNFATLTGIKPDADSVIAYSDEEMMLVASRFFHCDKINPKDTSAGYHICVGINGQATLKSEKDLTPLQAFCFEAIWDQLDGKKFSHMANFKEHLKKEGLSERKTFVSFSDHMSRMRIKGYRFMETEPELKKMLTRHYEANKDNIGFTININTSE